MDETTAAFRKVFEDMLLETETKVEYYHRMLGKPPVKNNTNCVKEIESLKSQLQEKTKELDNLQRYIAQQKDENEVLHRKVNDLLHKLSQAYRKRDELAEKLRNKSVLDSVLAQKYEKLQIALNSDIGEAFECELDDKPFEKGYYIRISKEAYDLSKDDRLFAHVICVKRPGK